MAAGSANGCPAAGSSGRSGWSGSGSSRPPQSTHRVSCQLPSAQSKTRSKTPRPPAGPPAAASTRHTSRSASRSWLHRRPRAGSAPRAVGAEHGVHPAGLPPRPGLHPVRDHVAHLPEPAAPQELLGSLTWSPAGPSAPSPAHFHGVVVPSHRSSTFTTEPTPRPRTRSLRRMAEGSCGGGGGRGHPRHRCSNTCSNNFTVHLPADCPSRAGSRLRSVPWSFRASSSRPARRRPGSRCRPTSSRPSAVGGGPRSR